MRAYVQKCNDPPVKTLMTFGSPHSGVADIPNCQHMESPSASCTLMRSIVRNGVYWGWIQNSVVQAQYFRRWQDLDSYYSGNIFLPDLNQEGPFEKSNPEYVEQLAKLEKLVLVRYFPI
jgi:palmitoyl-protein thioesterase